MVVLALLPIAFAANMNGDYLITRTSVIGAAGAVGDYAARGHEYFDVYSPPITSQYGETFWTKMDDVPLPKEIVERFADGVIAVTGYEMDQVTDDGLSIGYNRVYNHHYGAFLVGAGSSLRKMPCGLRDYHMGCMMNGEPSMWMAVPHDSNEDVPSSQFFSEGNGGESRKSFHGYPDGYAQLVARPRNFSLIPMQIDTWNRDTPVHDHDYIAGPLPRAAQSPPGSVYSGLLECPCTDRITKVNDSICSLEGGCWKWPSTAGQSITGDFCPDEPLSQLKAVGNRICSLDTYPGGQMCCPHKSILLDKDQDPWPGKLLTYRMKFRFWFQPWRPPAAVAARLPPARLGAPNPPAAASHANLVRFYWQTESFAGEYDVPRGADSLGHDRGATTYSEAEGYVYTIASEWPAADSVYGCDPTRKKCVPDGTNGFELVYAGGHCHAPNCISLELTIKETGELLCLQRPVRGNGSLTDPFDDMGYITLPPCLWGRDGESGGRALPPRPRVPLNATLRSVCRQNSTVGHYGQMASWQMRGVFYYD